jgi:hypothetical protein
VEKERAALDDRGFAVERLGIGDWPPVDAFGGGVIKMPRTGLRLVDPAHVPAAHLSRVRCVAQQRRRLHQCGGKRDDDRYHVEVIDHRPGTGWVVPRLVELAERHQPAKVVCDGPARSLVGPPRAKASRCHEMTGPSTLRLAVSFVDAVNDDTVRHLGTSELRSAIRVRAAKPLGMRGNGRAALLPQTSLRWCA